MEPISLAIGLGLSAVGALTSIDAAQNSASAQKELLATYKEGEAVRKQAMEIDAQRRRREIIRQSIIARSQALAVGNAQGAKQGSGLQGAYGQISGQEQFGLSGVNSNEELGNRMFDINQRSFAARQSQASAGAEAAIGQGLSSLGGTVINNMGSISRLSGGWFSGSAGTPAFGSGGR